MPGLRGSFLFKATSPSMVVYTGSRTKMSGLAPTSPCDNVPLLFTQNGLARSDGPTETMSSPGSARKPQIAALKAIPETVKE